MKKINFFLMIQFENLKILNINLTFSRPVPSFPAPTSKAVRTFHHADPLQTPIFKIQYNSFIANFLSDLSNRTP